MILSMLNGKSGKFLRWPSWLNWTFPAFPEEVRRPAIFSLWFWSALAISYVIWALDLLGTDPSDDLFGVGQGWDLVPGTLATGFLAAVWLLLPWDPRANRRRKLAAPAFLATVLAMNLVFGGATVTHYSFAFYPLAFANGVFLFGFVRGIYYAATVLVVVFADTLLSIRLGFPEYAAESGGWALGNALGMAAIFVPVAVLMIGFCAPIVEANRRREETESLLVELKSAHTQLESAHVELKEYAGRVRELAVSEERARMAREMHDSVGHYLTVVNVQLQAAARSMDRDLARAREQVAKAKISASEALSEVRRSVRALKPRAVESGSVAGALSALARDFEDAGPAVSFELEGDEYALSTEAELTLYRALQESLTNALKHAKARRVSVSLNFGENGVKLAVADDGVGAPGGDGGRGYGLPALEERVGALGGTFSAGNVLEGGFVVRVELPAGSS